MIKYKLDSQGNLLIVWIRSDEKKKWMKDFQWKVVFLALRINSLRFYTPIIFNFLNTLIIKITGGGVDAVGGIIGLWIQY